MKKIKIYDIEKDQCSHKMWGINCDRNEEILRKVASTLMLLERAKPKSPLETLMREVLKIAKDEQEICFIVFLLGKATSSAGLTIGIGGEKHDS